MFTRRRNGGDFDREIQSHLELETERLIEEGVSPAAARRAARRRFGNVTSVRERFYEAGRLLWLDHLRQDLRCAIRNIRRYPVASIIAILSLAAGIGATTVSLMVRDAVFYKPPPTYSKPQELSRVQVGRPERRIDPIGSPVPAGLYAIWSDALGPSIAGSATLRGLLDIRTEDRTETLPVRTATSEFFSVLGVAPEIGQTFAGARLSGVAHTPALLSHRLWQLLFDGRQDVVGRVLWIDNRPHVVVGVLPQRFWFSDMASPIWTPLDPRTLGPEEEVEVVVRRHRGMTTAMLDSQLQHGLAEYAERLPADRRQLRLKVSGIEGTPVGNSVAFVLPYVLGTSVLLTLLIACANVAVLLIAQWTAREHEIAIRASIGGSRSRIVRSLLSESVLVAFAGGILGVCATFAIRGWIVRRGGADITFFDLSIEPAILLQSAIITLLAGIIAGIAPALYETRRLQVNPLRRIASPDRVRQRWRHALVVLEITVTVALVVETAAMVDGYNRARAAQMGFATHPLLSATIENQRGVPASRILEILTTLPGVETAGASSSLPYAAIGPQQRIATDAAGSNAVTAERGEISARFFAALGVPIRAGRSFSDLDTAAARTAIANQALVKRLFNGQNAVGSRVWIGETSYEIIGVVADYSSNPMHRLVEPRLFVPFADSANPRRMHFLVRADGDPSTLIPAIRRAIPAAITGTVVTHAYTFDQILRVVRQEILLGSAPLFPLAAIGMLLTTAGIYGVLAFAIERRSRELAVRMAVGAQGSDLIWLISAHTARLVTIGLVLGLGLMFGLSRIVRASGGAGSFMDPALYIFAVPIALVLGIAVIATWMPSRRALKIDPAVLLRSP